MNNVTIFLAAAATLFIGFIQCYNPEDMALFVLACFITIPAMIAAIVGIITDQNIFEM